MGKVNQRQIEQFRKVTERVTRALSERHVKVTQIGSKAYVAYDRAGNVNSINIPSIPDDADEAIFAATRGFVDHEVAHVLFTNANEGATRADFASERDFRAVHMFSNMVEDTRIEREMRLRYGGSDANLTWVFNFIADRVIKPALDKAIENGDQTGIFNNGIMPVARAWAGDVAARDFVDSYNLEHHLAPILNKLDEVKERLPTISSTAESLELAKLIFAAIQKAPDPEPTPESDSDDAEQPEDSGKSTDSNENTSDGEAGENPPPPEEGGEGQDDAERDQEEEDQGEDQGEGADEESADEESGGEENAAGDSDCESDGDGESDAAIDAASDSADHGDDEGSDASDGAGDGHGGEDQDGNEASEAGDGAGDGSDSDAAEPNGSADLASEGDPEGEQQGEVEDVHLDLTRLGELTDTSDTLRNVISTMSTDAMRSSGSYLPYSTDLDKVVDVKVSPSASINKAVEWQDRFKTQVGQIQARIRRMLAQQDFVANYGGYRSGKIQAASLHRLLVGDDRVFSRREEHNAENTAFTLLVDCSGSMSGDKIVVACETAFLMAETLSRLGINFEILGFSCADHLGFTAKQIDEYEQSRKRNSKRDPKTVGFTRLVPLVHYVFKAFDQKWDKDRKAGVAWTGQATSPKTNVYKLANCDGESVAWAADRLLRQRERRKIMMVLSDGEPSLSGYENSQVLADHLKKTVARIEGLGVETVGIGICSKAVTKFYPKSVVVHKPEDLSGVVLSEIEGFLKASKQR